MPAVLFFSFDACNLPTTDTLPNATSLYESLTAVSAFISLRIDVKDRTIVISLATGTSVAVEAELAALLALHTGAISNPLYYTIYELAESSPANWSVFPGSLNYRTALTSSIYPHRTLEKGEIVKTVWYADKKLTKPLIDVDIEYTRNTGGLAVSRTTTRRWFLSDGSLGKQAKTTEKIYDLDPLLQIAEVRRRRQNIYYTVELNTVNWLLANLQGATPAERLNLGRFFIGQHKTALENFVSAGLPGILEDIKKDESKFLQEITDIPKKGDTIKDMILAELDIWS